MLTRFIALALVAATTPLASAAQIYVPAGGDLQAAIDSAVANDEILVDGGVHAPVVIDKPLSITGVVGNMPLLRPTDVSEFICPFPFGGCSTFEADAPIRLAGAGGVVTLTGLQIAGSVEHSFFSNFPSAIEGGGFHQLDIVDCTVTAPESMNPTGLSVANHAVNVSIDEITVTDSTITGGTPVSDTAWPTEYIFPAGDGIRTTGDVTICGSTVRGGNGLVTNAHDQMWTVGCADFSGGNGGAGVRTGGTVSHGNSTIAGGNGTVLTIWWQGPSYSCARPDGSDFAVPAGQVIPTSCGGSAAAWSNVGSALPGVFGDPDFTGSGPLTPGSSNPLVLSNAAPNAHAALFYNLMSDPVAFKGGMLEVGAQYYLYPFLTSAVGEIAFDLTMPATALPAGTELFAQWVIQDAAAAQNYAISPAIKAIP
ncbi:MAG: hypothetical protein DRQ55_03130 [Planctomycetota bacterium]|nr:MAG: hypothetical protein DRQ55_03130 [Planctomycetota bacterium]